MNGHFINVTVKILDHLEIKSVETGKIIPGAQTYVAVLLFGFFLVL